MPARGRETRRRRVLVLSLPALEWGELYRGDTPALDELLDGAGRRRAVGAGRAAGDRRRRWLRDASARAPAPGACSRRARSSSPPRTSPARPPARCSQRNTGHAVDSGLLAFGFPALLSRNDRLDYGAEIGALGQALADAGVPRAVIANADGVGPAGRPHLQPHRGAVAPDRRARRRARRGGRRPACSRPTPTAPFGVRYATEAVGRRLRRGVGRRRGGARRGLRPRPGRPLPAAGGRRGTGPRCAGDALRAHRRPDRRPAGVGGPGARRRARRRPVPPRRRGPPDRRRRCARPGSSPGCCARRAPAAPGSSRSSTSPRRSSTSPASSARRRWRVGRFERAADGDCHRRGARRPPRRHRPGVALPRRHGRARRDRVRRPAGRPLDRRGAGPPAATSRSRSAVVGARGAGHARCTCRPPTSRAPSTSTARRRSAYWAFVVGVAVVAVAGRRPRSVAPRAPSTRSCSCLGRRVRPPRRRHAPRRPAAAQHRVRVLADGRRALRRHGQPRLRPVRGRGLPAVRPAVPAARRPAAAARRWPSACWSWPS